MNRFHNRRQVPIFSFGFMALLLAGLVLVGCGGDRLSVVPVEGKVLYQGKPLEFGAVTFQPAAGPPASGAIQSDGSFRLSTYGNQDGAVPGMHKVAIVCFDSQRPDAPPPDPSAEPGLGKPLIPRKYLSADTSGLTAEVKSRNEPFEFTLTD